MRHAVLVDSRETEQDSDEGDETGDGVCQDEVRGAVFVDQLGWGEEYVSYGVVLSPE